MVKVIFSPAKAVCPFVSVNAGRRNGRSCQSWSCHPIPGRSCISRKSSLKPRRWLPLLRPQQSVFCLRANIPPNSQLPIYNPNTLFSIHVINLWSCQSPSRPCERIRIGSFKCWSHPPPPSLGQYETCECGWSRPQPRGLSTHSLPALLRARIPQ
jgi:hypothetical protein